MPLYRLDLYIFDIKILSLINIIHIDKFLHLRLIFLFRLFDYKNSS